MSSRFTGYLEEGRISSSQGSSHQGCPGTGNTGPAMFRLGLKAQADCLNLFLFYFISQKY
jgi:hypothetical protein